MIPVLIIPILNRYDLLDGMLNTIDYPIKEVCVINNGKETFTPSRTDLNIRVLNLPSNLGMSGSWNLAIKLYPHEPYWMFASADTHCAPGSLEKFNQESGEDRLSVTADAWTFFSIGANIIRSVGLFDERFYPIYFEDNDYYERIIRSGKESCYVSTGIQMDLAEGSGSQTIKSDENLSNRNNETFVKNKEYFEKKKSEDFKILGAWDIDVRRANEWLR